MLLLGVTGTINSIFTFQRVMKFYMSFLVIFYSFCLQILEGGKLEFLNFIGCLYLNIKEYNLGTLQKCAPKHKNVVNYICNYITELLLYALIWAIIFSDFFLLPPPPTRIALL